MVLGLVLVVMVSPRRGVVAAAAAVPVAAGATPRSIGMSPAPTSPVGMPAMAAGETPMPAIGEGVFIGRPSKPMPLPIGD